MKNKNYITKYLIIILPLLFINLNAQDQADPVEETTATEEVESTEAAAEATAEAEETESIEATPEVEEFVVKESSGFNLGFTSSIGFVNGALITNTPAGGSLVINTPYGFNLGGLGINISLVSPRSLF